MKTSPHQEPRHSIQLVSRRTGLTAAALRAWERRYDAIRPGRSDTRRRLYSDEDVERLLLLRRATLAGRRIGSIAGLSVEELEQLIREDEAAAARVPSMPLRYERTRTDGTMLDTALDAVEDLDAPRLEALLRRASLEQGTIELMEGLLMPLLEEVGSRWRSGTMRIHQEHLATSVVRTLLESLRSANPRPASAPEILVATPPAQIHELGALMVAVTASAKGWRVAYLGTDLPVEEIAAAAIRCNSRAIALSLVHPTDDPDIPRSISRLRALLPPEVAVLVGGQAATAYRDALARDGVNVLRNLEGLRRELDRLRLR